LRLFSGARWLLVKDLQILRRSPLLVGLLIVYPIAIALMIGFALSSPPGKPKVAFYSAIAPGKGKISFGNQQINISKYANELFRSVQPIKVHSQQEAIAKVRDGEALAALIVPADIVSQIQSLVTQGAGSPTVQLVLNSKDPLERQFVNGAIATRLNEVEQAVSKQVLRVAVSDLRQVLNGGSVQLLGQNVPLLGLRNSRAIVQGTISSLPPHSSLRTALRQVVNFADLAIDGLGFATPVLSSIGSPLTVQQTQLAGKTTPTNTYAVAIAVIVSLMFVTVLLAAGMLALERSENAYPRLVRGLVSEEGLLSEKVVLAAGCAALVTLLMAAGVSAFVHLDWGRFELWVLALAFGGLAFGAMGVAIGGLAREVSAASLMAFLVSLPIAFVALVPADSVSSGVKTALDVVAFAFPFKAALQAADNAFSGTSPGIGWPLVHLLALTVVFAVLARLAMRRFSAA
jgi:ABC-2 type transport system permease protein